MCNGDYTYIFTTFYDSFWTFHEAQTISNSSKTDSEKMQNYKLTLLSDKQ